MIAPTAADIRAWLPPDFNWAKVGGWPTPTPPAPDPLDKRVEWAIGYIESTTFRPFSSIEPPATPGDLPTIEAGPPMVSPPPNLIPLAEQATLMRVMQLLAEQSKGHFQAAQLQDYIQQFTAGSYTEIRGAVENVIRSRGGSVENPLVNRWRDLSDLLYLLMTPQAYDYWHYRLTGVPAPAATFIPGHFDDGCGDGWPSIAVGSGIENGWPFGWGW